MSTPQKVYIALNGEEAIKKILSDVEKALRGSGELTLNQTFHKFEYVGGFKLRAYHRRGVDVKVSGAAGVSYDDEQVHDFEVKVAHEAAPPDKVRESLAGEEKEVSGALLGSPGAIPAFDLDEKRMEFERREKENARLLAEEVRRREEVASELARQAGLEAEYEEAEREKLALATRAAAAINDESTLAGQEAANSGDVGPIVAPEPVSSVPDAVETPKSGAVRPLVPQGGAPDVPPAPSFAPNLDSGPVEVVQSVKYRKEKPRKLLRPGNRRENRTERQS